eukprot:4157986-Pyramimonas_sp.AAC.2
MARRFSIGVEGFGVVAVGFRATMRSASRSGIEGGIGERVGRNGVRCKVSPAPYCTLYNPANVCDNGGSPCMPLKIENTDSCRKACRKGCSMEQDLVAGRDTGAEGAGPLDLGLPIRRGRC